MVEYAKVCKSVKWLKILQRIDIVTHFYYIFLMIWSSDWLTEWCCFIIVNHSVVGRDYETNWNTLLFVQCWSAAWWISIECWIRNCKAILVKQNNMWRIPIRRFRRRHCAELRFFIIFLTTQRLFSQVNRISFGERVAGFIWSFAKQIVCDARENGTNVCKLRKAYVSFITATNTVLFFLI